MSFDQSGGVDVNQSGKSGGDVTGIAGAGAGADAGSGSGSGTAWVRNVDPIGTGVGVGGDSGAMAGAGQSGGDVSDNTSIGDINISS
ncbi:MAG: hypothetical protein HQL53_01940 [Magnetococcales bacterium]|nr:hypothetical protein [Magnetococcales bacterium]